MNVDGMEPLYLPEPPSAGREAHRVDNSLAIRALIRDLEHKRALITLFAGNDHRVYTASRIVHLDDQSIEFDLRTDAHRLASLTDSPRCTVVAFLDDVKVQFDLPAARPVATSGSTRLRACYPPHAYRIQRRDAFRVKPQAADQLVCWIREAPGLEHAVRVLDISATGIAVAWPRSRPLPAKDASLPHCRIDGAIEGPLPCTLVACHGSETAANAAHVRAGFSFADLPPEIARRVQMLVMAIELDRRRKR